MNTPSLIFPPGFRFHPTDEELMSHYLKRKVSSPSNPELSIIANINIYKFDPWELPGQAVFGESEWFFFSPRDRKYPNSVRPNRTAVSGYWKATGTDKPILTSNGSLCIGVKKALVFYKGRAPKGIKTNWMMLEYRLLDDTHYLQKGTMRLDDLVLCRVRHKNGPIKEKEEVYESSCGSNPVLSLKCLQGQEEIKRNMRLKSYNYEDFQVYPNHLEKDAADIQVGFQKRSPENSSSAVTSDFQSIDINDTSINETLESIKKVLSLGALDELLQMPQKKRLHISTSNNSENANIFQVSSPTTLPSYSHSFHEFTS